jgi:transcriptional regulator with XRE-family HTH domain
VLRNLELDEGMGKKQGNPIDIHVGNRVRLRRMLIGMSQEKLGELLGLTFQQVQKYEKGTNRIGAGRLFHVSQILGVPVQFFYEDLPADQLGHPAARRVEEDTAPYVMDYVTSPEGLQLNRHFFRITDARVRRRILDLVKTLAGAEGDTALPEHHSQKLNA